MVLFLYKCFMLSMFPFYFCIWKLDVAWCCKTFVSDTTKLLEFSYTAYAHCTSHKCRCSFDWSHQPKGEQKNWNSSSGKTAVCGLPSINSAKKRIHSEWFHWFCAIHLVVEAVIFTSIYAPFWWSGTIHPSWGSFGRQKRFFQVHTAPHQTQSTAIPSIL